MALSEREKQIVEFGKQQGKSRTETLQAVSRFRAEQQQIETERGNIGTGFTPSQEFTGEESVTEAAGKAVRNLPRSASEFGRNITSAITSPIETGRSIFNLISGAAGKGAEAIAESTNIGQQLLERADQSRKEQGLEPLPRDDQGRLQAPQTEDMEAVNAVSDFFGERYGGVENFKETAVEDPVGVLADIAGLVSGTGAVLRGAGTAARSSALQRAGQTVTRAGQAAEPTNIAGRAAGAVGRGVSGAARTTGRVAREIGGDFLPGQRRSVIKALDLTPGDIRKIEGKTGNQIDEFILENQISGTNADDIAEGLKGLRQDRYQRVRNLVNDVDTTYTSSEVPRVRDALNSLDELYSDTRGLEDLQNEISSLLGKDQYNLTDVQRTKELLDDADNIFKQSGEVRAGAQSQGLANIRQDLRQFIEDEVSSADISPNLRRDDVSNDIRQLNNEVQTAKEIEKAVLDRSTRDLTRKQIGLTDWVAGGALGTGAISGTLEPATAIGLFVTKKALENPAFKISLARNIKRLGESKAAEIFDTIKQGEALSSDNANAVRNAIESARRESGLTIPVIETVEETSEREQ